ncbi:MULTISPECIES: FUSC family protein [Nocardiopsidaceae]|uniref:FUSC family protein n=1 Tax=Streptomonospora nanhaiensis TaxID=1323731 RepID=UPI003D366808
MRRTPSPLRAGRRRLAVAAEDARERVTVHFWSVVQAVVAAVVAWTVAGGLVQDHDPFFAPIAAVIALNTSGGERGANAVRLLTGVVFGIISGEVAIALTGGGGYGALALGVGLAMTAALAIGVQRIVIGQAAASAILTVVFAVNFGGGHAGLGRLTDALIGAGVALVFSQLLFPARLVAILRRIEADALTEMAHMLDVSGRALRRDDESSSQEMVTWLGDLSRPMAELSRARENSRHTVRLSTIRWGDPAPVLAEDEVIDRLILLGESCLFLARTTAAMSEDERHELAPVVSRMASVLYTLADDLSSRRARQEAVEGALRSARRFDAQDTGGDPVTTATHLAVEMVATDIMVFAGIRFEEAEEALREDEADLEVPHPPGVPWLPWLPWRPPVDRYRHRWYSWRRRRR